jgi:hypothetical protein
MRFLYSLSLVLGALLALLLCSSPALAGGNSGGTYLIDQNGNTVQFTPGQQLMSNSSPVVISSDQLGTINVPPTGNIFTVQGPCVRSAANCTPAPVIIGGWDSASGANSPCQNSVNGGDYPNTTLCGAALSAQCKDTAPTVQSESKWGWVRMSCRNHNLVIDLWDDGAHVWNFAGAGLSNSTTAVTIVAANASLKNCLNNLDLSWATLSAPTTVVIRDGAGGTVLWRGGLPTTAGNLSPHFVIPKCGAATNTLLEVAEETAVTGLIYVNAGGIARQ